jgi:hypothetical protein
MFEKLRDKPLASSQERFETPLLGAPPKFMAAWCCSTVCVSMARW